MKKWSKLTKYQAFWPFVILLAIIVFNGIITGGSFFQMKIVDGHLYGRVIDIIRNGSKLMILAAGMTMVLATGGTDISVGSVMAISGAVAGCMQYYQRQPLPGGWRQCGCSHLRGGGGRGALRAVERLPGS